MNLLLVSTEAKYGSCEDFYVYMADDKYFDRRVGSVTSKPFYEKMTDQPSDRPTNRRTWAFIGKLRFQKWQIRWQANRPTNQQTNMRDVTHVTTRFYLGQVWKLWGWNARVPLLPLPAIHEVRTGHNQVPFRGQYKIFTFNFMNARASL